MPLILRVKSQETEDRKKVETLFTVELDTSNQVDYELEWSGELGEGKCKVKFGQVIVADPPILIDPDPG